MASDSRKISLSTHAVRVRERYRGDPLPLGGFDGIRNVIDEFHAFVDELSKVHTNDLLTRSVLKTEWFERNDDSVWGRVLAGPYGYGGPIVHSETFETAHTVSPKEAVLQPFYFVFYAPLNTRKGVLILQRRGGRGIQTVFEATLRSFFPRRNPSHIMDIDSLVPNEVLRHLFEGEVKRINIRSYKLPKDLASKVQFGGNIEQLATFNQLIQARPGGSIPRPAFLMPEVLNDIIRGRRRLAEIVEGGEGDVDEMKITFVYNGHQRTIDLARPDRILPYIDVSDEVVIGPDGHPTVDTLHASALRLLNDIVNEMGRPDASED